MITSKPIKFAHLKKFGAVSIHSADVGGMTYVARWVKTSLLEDLPANLGQKNMGHKWKHDMVVNSLKGYAARLPAHCVPEKALIEDAVNLLLEYQGSSEWREKRLAASKSLREVAKAVGTSMGNLSRIENGKQIPSEGLSARLTAKFDEWKLHAGDRA
jgi:hypothetical protein